MTAGSQPILATGKLLRREWRILAHDSPGDWRALVLMRAPAFLWSSGTTYLCVEVPRVPLMTPPRHQMLCSFLGCLRGCW